MDAPKATSRELYADKDQATMTYGGLGVVVWRGECTLRGVQRVKEMGLAALANAPGGAMLVGVVEETSVIPSPEARRLSAEINDQLFDAGVFAFGAIFPDHGFSGAWKRGVITGLNMLSRRRYPFKVFQRPLEACHWFSDMPQAPKMDWALAAGALERFRQEYSARFPRVVSMSKTA